MSQANLEQLVDPFEAGFNRTAYRVALFCMPWIGLSAAMLADAYIDHLKGKRIRSEIDRLNTAFRNPKAYDDVDIQREICSNIQNYTDYSKFLKTTFGLIGMTCFVLYRFDSSGGWEVLGEQMRLSGFFYCVIRRYTEGLLLQANNVERASRLSYAPTQNASKFKANASRALLMIR